MHRFAEITLLYFSDSTIYVFSDNRDRKGELECPACEETFNTSEITRDIYPKKQLEKAIVFCPNKGNGCKNESKLKDLDVHLEGCPFQLLECIHKSRGCTAVVLRGRLAEHIQKECMFRLSKCEFCDQEFPAADLEVWTK